MMKISLVLEAVNRMSGPLRAVGQAVRNLDGVLLGLAERAGIARAALQRLGGAEMAAIERSMGRLKGMFSGVAGALGILKYAAAGAIVALGVGFVRGVFKAGGEAQQMLVTLTRIEGSASRARKAMDWMQSFAMGPGAGFAMPDIMRAYQMAQNFGMKPQGGSLAAFADLAAGERVPLKQVLIAVKDAMEGTSTRPLANLGIKMRQGRKPGDPNSYLYANAAGQFVTETSAKTPEATLATLLKIINAKYLGLASAQAKTVPGGIEQLKKLLYLFEMKVAGAGVFDWALAQMNRFFAFVRTAQANGTLDRLAGQISHFLTSTGDRIIAFVRQTNWAAVAKDLRLFLGLLGAVLGLVKMAAAIGGGGLSGLFNIIVVKNILQTAGALAGLARVMQVMVPTLEVFGASLAIAEWPITAIIIGIGLLVAAAWLIYANWGKFGGWWRAFWGSMPGWLKTGVVLAMVAINPLLLLPGLIMSAWRTLTGFFSRLWAGIKASVPSLQQMFPLPSWIVSHSWNALFGPKAATAPPGGPRVPPLLRAPAAGGRAAPAHGKLTVEFQNAPPGMRVRELHGAGMDLDVKRGPVMGRPG